MDTRTGDIYDEGKIRKMLEENPKLREHFVRMMIPPTTKQLSRKPSNQLSREVLGKVGRNEKCPCGSGKKFKKCCWVRAPRVLARI